MAAIPDLVAPLRPLAAFWEPLSEQAGYMMVMSGPVKIDLFPLGGTRILQPPWEVRADNFVSIDGHFWDWLLWLGSKSLRRETNLLAEQLNKMHWFLLGPLGVKEVPRSLGDAAALYIIARSRLSHELRTAVPEELGHQVVGALRSHHLI